MTGLLRVYAASAGEKNFPDGPEMLVWTGANLDEAKAALKRALAPGWMVGRIVADPEIAAALYRAMLAMPETPASLGALFAARGIDVARDGREQSLQAAFDHAVDPCAP